MKPIQVLITEEEHKKLKIIAATEGTTISSMVRSVLFGKNGLSTSEELDKPTFRDVVDGTPKGQEAVRKAVVASIKDQNAVSKKLCKHGALPSLCKFAPAGKVCK